MKCQLIELTAGGYRLRTRCNVQDCDGTLSVNFGGLDGGTLATRTLAERMGKPYLVVQLEIGSCEVSLVATFAEPFKWNIARVQTAN